MSGQSVELAQTISASFTDTAGDGLLGLAFGCINTVKPHPVHTPVENMISQTDIPADSALFTAYLTNHNDHDPCNYTFGYIDADLVQGRPIHYTPIDTSRGFWQIPSTSAVINGQKCPLANNTAIMDTGTTLSLIDDSTCKNVYAAIPGATYDANEGGYVFPKSTPMEKLPVVQFAIGEELHTVHKRDLAYAEVGAEMVYGGIQSRGNLGWSIFGGTHLKGMYAVFDQVCFQFSSVSQYW